MARVKFQKVGTQRLKITLLGGVFSQFQLWHNFISELYGDDVKLEDSFNYALSLYFESNNVVASEFRRFQQVREGQAPQLAPLPISSLKEETDPMEESDPMEAIEPKLKF